MEDSNRAKRRQEAIKRQEERQARRAAELARLPAEALQRQVRRYKIRPEGARLWNMPMDIQGIRRVRDKKTFETECLFFVFTGEWGYEILSSHGWLRKLKTEHPNITVGIASRAGAEFLYEDAHDFYVDITDLLASYDSRMFGITLHPDDAAEVEKRCRELVPDKRIDFVYSSRPWSYFEIDYGGGEGRGTRLVRDPLYLGRQYWKMLTLESLYKEKREIDIAFPGLLESEYIIVQDRRRSAGWGGKSYSQEAWQAILEWLSDKFKCVLIGYKPWRRRDAESLFYTHRFEDIKNTINMSDFLTDRLVRNLAYQAVLFKHAQFWFGVWGSASMLAPILGVRSYVLSAGRGALVRQQRDEKAWKSCFARCGGSLKYINTSLDKDMTLRTLKRVSLIPGPKIKDMPKKDRIAVVNICWNRLHYTKHCLSTLLANAGTEFDHYIIDNGSTDGTGEWLESSRHLFKKVITNKKNLGLGNAMVQIVKLMEKEKHDWCIVGPNDAEILTSDFIEKMSHFWKISKGRYLFAPLLTGIGHKPPVKKSFMVEDVNVKSIGTSGCVYAAFPVAMLADFLTKKTKWKARDFCRYVAARGMDNLYLADVEARHYETTAGQMERYPNMKKGYLTDINLKTPLPDNPGAPLVSFMTRCCKRPEALKRCCDSVATQLSKDFEQIFITDEKRRGLHWANQQYYAHRGEAKGKYIQFLDDDDYLIDPGFVSQLGVIDQKFSPDVVVFKIKIGDKVFPTIKSWNKSPIRGEIAGGCVCVKNEVFQKHIKTFGQPKAGDYFFIKEIFDMGYKILWEDRIIIQARRGHGRIE